MYLHTYTYRYELYFMLMVRPFNLASKRGAIYFFCFFRLSPNFIEKSDLQDKKAYRPVVFKGNSFDKITEKY